MKTITVLEWNDLDQKTKDSVLKSEINFILDFITNHYPEDTYPEIEHELRKAFKKADDLQTPWFLFEILMENKKINKFINQQAEDTCKEKLFYNDHIELLI